VNNIDDEKIVCEYWDTPIFQSNELWLEMQVFTENYVFFFFKRNHDSPEGEHYVLSIDGYSPFRITEEGLGWKVVGDLLKNNISPKDKQVQGSRTFKVWNTQFAIESCLGLAIPAEKYDAMEKFQYIIYTNDAWVQFVSFDLPKWTFHQGIKLDDLVIQYLRKDSLDD
jgi:hypothetical protein